MSVLYHGTSERFLEKILRMGICPRGRAPSENWPAKFASRKDMVYLTSAYAGYFAYNAVQSEERMLILEVDQDKLDVERMFPDEDYLGQCYAKQFDVPLETAHAQIRSRLGTFRHHWRASLSGMGTVAYRDAVPIEAVKRYALLEITGRPRLWTSFMDPSISIINFQHCGPKYIGMLEWVFGDRPLLPQIDDLKQWAEGAKDAETIRQLEVWKSGWEAESADRTGIEIVERKPCLKPQ